MLKKIGLVLALVVASASAWSQSPPTPRPPPKPVRVITFDGGWNLPLWAAQRQGFFEANGVAVNVTHTPNSGFLITGLLDGRFDVGLATIDNLLAYAVMRELVPEW